MRGIQKVCRLMQLITRYAHLILSLFNTVSGKWNAFDPAFLQSSDSVLLLILLFQPTICRADSVFPLKIALSHGGSGPHLMRGSLGQPESTPQMASRSVQPFLHGSRLWQNDQPTDRQTDHATPSVTIGRIYIVVRCGLIIRCAIL